jgi:putative nucleotidyltransferase with HDIG domain
MLKRIKPEQVRLGMFIEAIEGSWVDNPFWRSQIRLLRAKDVEKLKLSSVDAVIIDTDRGVDAASRDAPSKATASSPQKTAELKQALQTIEQSKPLIREMFEDARMGGRVSVANAIQTVSHIATCMKDSPAALIEVTRLKSRDEHTFLHSIAVSGLMVHLARAADLGEDVVRDVGIGGLLHDIGKMRIPLEVLHKAGPLTEREMNDVRLHPKHGYDLLSGQVGMPGVVLDICLHHHERIDGKGYPKGLSGEEISIPVRISTICDVYDALTSARAYKPAWAPIDAARFMLRQEGYFDRRLLMQFFHSLNI